MAREAALGDSDGTSAAAAAAADAAARVSRRSPGTWRRVRRAAQEAAAHALLLCFTTLLALKLDGVFFSRSWWVLFIPLWLFHAVVARYRFTLPAPSLLQTCQRIPCHSVVATPLLVAFELLLCIYLEGQGESFLDLKLVFLPLLALEIITLVDNFRTFGALMPGHGETITDEEIWERLPHFWIAISMVFLLAATSLMLLKLCGDAVTLGWWDLFITLEYPSALLFLSAQGAPIPWSDIGCPVLIIPILIFQVLLCMRLEGTPSNARFIPVRAIFSPILLLQVVALCFAVWRFFERLIAWSIDEHSKEEQAHLCYTNNIGYSTFCSYPPEMVKDMPKKLLVKEVQRLQLALGEQSKAAKLSQQRCERLKNERILCRVCFEWDICIVLLPCRHHVLCEYSTFCSYPPEMVKDMPKKLLVKEVQRLQLALGEQSKAAKLSQERCERLKNERILCRVCFEWDICIVLLPCRHHVLCEPCCNKCQSCPICRVPIERRLSVNGAADPDEPLGDIV